nr:hypothetical protein [Chitinophaga tropicalis]
MRKVTKTSGPSRQLSFEDKWTSSQGDFPASLSPTPETGKGRQTTAISGRKCFESLQQFNHVGSWQRMFQELLISNGEWYSKTCKLTWKLQATRYGRLYCRLVASAPPISETGSGLLPTPRATMIQETPEQWQARRNRIHQKMGPSLVVRVQQLLAQGLLPTPTARDWKGPQARSYHGQLDNLPGVIRFQHGMTGQLSPLFVGQMMGFAPDWTISPFLAGERKA